MSTLYLILLVVAIFFIFFVASKRKKTGGFRANVLDDNHLAFLSNFRDPYEIDNQYWEENWSRVLRRPCQEAVSDLIKHNLLRPADQRDKLRRNLRVGDIKQILKEHGLKVSGNKDELLNRFMQELPEEATKIAATIGDMYVCTQNGLQKAAEYMNKIAAKRGIAEDEVKALVSQGNLERASEVIRQFYRSLPGPMAGSDPNIGEATLIMAIKSVPGYSKEEVQKNKVDAVAGVLWGGPIQGPEQFIDFITIKVEKQRSREQLKGYAREEFIKYVEILCCDDSCPVCKAVANKKYLIKDAPLIPIDGCQHEMGCRCCYTPEVGEL